MSKFDCFVISMKALTVALFLIGAGIARETLHQAGLRPLLQGVALWAVGCRYGVFTSDGSGCNVQEARWLSCFAASAGSGLAESKSSDGAGNPPTGNFSTERRWRRCLTYEGTEMLAIAKLTAWR